MRLEGSNSWEFSHDLGQRPNSLLYIRDALRLPVPSAPGLPPHLDGEVPDRSELLEPSSRAAAALEWWDWWRSALTTESVIDLYDPSTLPQQSALRTATVALSEEAYRWPEEPRRRALESRRAALRMFSWTVVRDTVAAVAAERAVPAESLSGSASVVLVQGTWWHLIGSGLAVCSLAAALEPTVASEILRAVFVSGLTTHPD